MTIYEEKLRHSLLLENDHIYEDSVLRVTDSLSLKQVVSYGDCFPSYSAISINPPFLVSGGLSSTNTTGMGSNTGYIFHLLDHYKDLDFEYDLDCIDLYNTTVSEYGILVYDVIKVIHHLGISQHISTIEQPFFNKSNPDGLLVFQGSKTITNPPPPTPATTTLLPSRFQAAGLDLVEAYMRWILDVASFLELSLSFYAVNQTSFTIDPKPIFNSDGTVVDVTTRDLYGLPSHYTDYINQIFQNLKTILLAAGKTDVYCYHPFKRLTSGTNNYSVVESESDSYSDFDSTEIVLGSPVPYLSPIKINIYFNADEDLTHGEFGKLEIYKLLRHFPTFGNGLTFLPASNNLNIPSSTLAFTQRNALDVEIAVNTTNDSGTSSIRTSPMEVIRYDSVFDTSWFPDSRFYSNTFTGASGSPNRRAGWIYQVNLDDLDDLTVDLDSYSDEQTDLFSFVTGNRFVGYTHNTSYTRSATTVEDLSGTNGFTFNRLLSSNKIRITLIPLEGLSLKNRFGIDLNLNKTGKIRIQQVFSKSGLAITDLLDTTNTYSIYCGVITGSSSFMTDIRDDHTITVGSDTVLAKSVNDSFFNGGTTNYFDYRRLAPQTAPVIAAFGDASFFTTFAFRDSNFIDSVNENETATNRTWSTNPKIDQIYNNIITNFTGSNFIKLNDRTITQSSTSSGTTTHDVNVDLTELESVISIPGSYFVRLDFLDVPSFPFYDTKDDIQSYLDFQGIDIYDPQSLISVNATLDYSILSDFTAADFDGPICRIMGIAAPLKRPLRRL